MKFRVAGAAVLVGALVLVATPVSEAGKGPRERQRTFLLRAHVVDFDADEHPRRRSRRRGFNGYETHTIEFDVFRRGRAGVERPTQVKLYLPNGDLYGAFEVSPFEDDSVRERAHPVATARVPVAGTMITRYRLYGEWRADICWEVGIESSCRRALGFVIR